MAEEDTTDQSADQLPENVLGEATPPEAETGFDAAPETKPEPTTEELFEEERTALRQDLGGLLGGEYDELTTSQNREVYLMRELKERAAKPAGESTTERDIAPTDRQKPEAPSVPQIPDVDTGAARAKLVELLGDQLGGEVAAGVAGVIIDGLFTPVRQEQYGTAALMQQSLGEWSGQIAEATLPGQLKAIVSNVPDAIEADVPEALAIFRKGDTSSHEVAIELAAARRRRRVTEAQTPRVSSDDAKRRAAGMVASQQASGGSRAGGSAPLKPPTNTAELAEMIKQSGG